VIAVKITAWFLLLALLPMVVVALLTYSTAKSHIEKEVTVSLETIADDKVRRIETYVTERKRDITTFSHDSFVIEAMAGLSVAFKKGGLSSSEYAALDRLWRAHLTYYTESAGYYNLLLLSAEGDAVFSVKRERDLGSNYKTGPFKDSQLAKVFDRSSTMLEADISGYAFYIPSGDAAAFVAAPILHNGSLIGVLALQIHSRDVLDLAQDFAGLGTTGESIFGARIGDSVVFMNPTRHDLAAAFQRKVIIGSPEARALQEAVQGKRGIGIVVDYRGQQVLAAWRYLPSFRWGLVVKIDSAEAFAPASELRRLVLRIGLVTAFLMTLVAFLVARCISQPITQLTNTARLFANDDFSQRAKVTTRDEIGELASVFNLIAGRVDSRTFALGEANKELQTHKKQLEELVKARTTELKKANEELKKELINHKLFDEQLRQSEKLAALGTLVDGVSHELNNPLFIISGYAQLGKETCRRGQYEKVLESLESIEVAAQQMAAIISRFVAVANPGPTEVRACDVNAIINESLWLLKNDFLRHQIEVLGALQENLPTVSADPQQVAQVFMNLMTNARQALERVDRKRQVAVRTVLVTDVIEIRISDNGPGIPDEKVPHMFEPFYTDRIEATGAGLGLSLCHRIISSLNGTIEATSEEGKGATFIIRIPAS
jgi:signal transduction histidine kinase